MVVAAMITMPAALVAATMVLVATVANLVPHVAVSLVNTAAVFTLESVVSGSQHNTPIQKVESFWVVAAVPVMRTTFPAAGGGDGGPIIFIKADSIRGLAGSIYARGRPAGTGGGDGPGGGGGGGTVIIDARAFHPEALNIYVSGGNGGNHNWGGPNYNSKGKGGGGGGGVVWHTGANLPAQVNSIVSGGAQGAETGATCNGHTGGSQAGGNGAVLNNLTLPINGITWPTCTLPVEFALFDAEKVDETRVRLQWQTFTERNNARFEVQRSADGQSFTTIGTVTPATPDNDGAQYEWDDLAPMNGNNWYRLKQVDLNGATTLTETKLIVTSHDQVYIESLFPNPIKAAQTLTLRIGTPEAQKAKIKVLDAFGKTVARHRSQLEAGMNAVELETKELAAGIYFVQVQAGPKRIVRKVVVMD